MTTETSNIIDGLADKYGVPHLVIDSIVNLTLNRIDNTDGLETYLGEVGMPWKTLLSSLAVDHDSVIFSQITTKDWTNETINKFNELFHTQVLPEVLQKLER